ncbi:MAG: hypothetical protein QF448_07945 [Candidatus Thalassarchaeaceae archaeon]|nr:hypothetical protein [Candidatus Thalassarchaeaceae archaeon]
MRRRVDFSFTVRLYGTSALSIGRTSVGVSRQIGVAFSSSASGAA